jgi:hypothetical protein
VTETWPLTHFEEDNDVFNIRWLASMLVVAASESSEVLIKPNTLKFKLVFMSHKLH